MTVVAPVDALVSLTAQDELFAVPARHGGRQRCRGRAGGVSVLAVDGLTIDAGRIVAVAEGTAAVRRAPPVAQDGLTRRSVPLSATASSLAAGLTFAVRDDAAVRADDVRRHKRRGGPGARRQFDAGSPRTCRPAPSRPGAAAAIRRQRAFPVSPAASSRRSWDVAASAMEAIGLYLQAGEGANVTQSGAMTATSSADGGLAAGAVFLAGSALAVDADRLEAVATGADTEAVGAI